MRHLVPAVTVAGLLLAGTVVAAPAGAAPAAPTAVGTVTQAHPLRPGQRLVSPDRRYRAAAETSGRLVIRTAAGRWVWSSPRTAARATLAIGSSGQLQLRSGSRSWTADTAGSGATDVLRLGVDGVLTLTAGGLTVWSDRLLNACPHTRGKTFVVDLGDQAARMCSGGQQVRATRVTTGATAKGDATPRGTWHVQAKVRNTTLYPASGGAYPVKYWVPYDGAYGIHDSPWQHFAYGSAKYRTDGSHGCTHVPGAMMAWFYRWVRIGTTVTIHR